MSFVPEDDRAIDAAEYDREDEYLNDRESARQADLYERSYDHMWGAP